jgi:hypothetical protein
VRALLLLVALAGASFADITRPAFLGLTETGPGRFDVVWRVPRRGDRVLAVRARLPEVLREVAAPSVELEADVQTTRWTVEGKPWELSGAIVAVEGPGLARVDVMVRFEFRDGTVVVRILPPGTTECTFPLRAAARSPAREVQADALAGMWLGVPALVFLLGLAFSGHARVALLFFLGGQLVGLVAGAIVPGPVAGALLGVAGALAATAPERRQLCAIAALCGLAHGGHLPGAAAALGIDAVGLAIAFAVSWFPRRPVARYFVGTAGIATALIVATAPGAVPETGPRDNVLLAPAAATGPASAPVAAATDAPLQVFLEVTPFETRVEWVARVAALDVGSGATIRVSEQALTKARIRERFARRLEVLLDGKPVTAADVRVDFVTREAGGILERVEPVPEERENALVGIAYSFPTSAPPGRVDVRWEGPGGIPAVVVDPRTTRTATLDRELTWSDTLAMPAVRAVDVRGEAADVSLLALALLASVAFVRRLWFLRLALAGACLVAPYAQVAVPLPGTPAPDAEVVEALLQNVYRTLDQPDESAAYDRLSLSVTQAALGSVYLEQRRMLELGRRGGARARVDSVEVEEMRDVESRGAGYAAVVAWEAGGFVVHYGHRHFRQSAYEARVELVAEDGAWRIASLEVLGKRRTR